LAELIAELHIGDRVLLHDAMDTRSIARVIENADLGVVPKRRDGFGDEAFSTKIMEFMALGVPVVVSNTRVDTYYFNDSVVKFFKAGDDADLAKVMSSAIRDSDLRTSMRSRAKEFVDQNNWACLQSSYLKIVDTLAT